MVGLALVAATSCGSQTGLQSGDEEALLAVQSADEALVAGRPDRALQILEEALERRPRSLEAHREFARLAAMSNRLDEALEAYTRVLEADPKDAEAARGLIQIALFVGRTDLVDLSSETLHNTPVQTSEDLALLARAALEAGDTEAAERLARRGTELPDPSPESWYFLARTLLDSGATEEALGHLERAIALDPDHAGAWFALGTELLRTDQSHERGREALSRADAIRTLDAQSFRRADPDQRLTIAMPITLDQPRWGRVWIEIGRAQLELGKASAAATALDRALELGRESIGLLELRARAAERLNQTSDVQRFEQRIQELERGRDA
jgi:tetratricopeptide (TPR) repeat protein